MAAAVGFARDHGVALGVKGGGHNIAGTAIAAGGLTLDLSGMRTIAVDPEARLAHVGPGCRLGDVDRATQAHGLATPLGFISEVGVAGLTLGGGLGYLTRRFGWTVDNLVEVEIVSADGQVRTASREQHPDLFWALRGGGGNLGVVTRFSFRLHPVGPTVYGGLIAWPFERAGEVMAAYRTLTAAAPRELAIWLLLLAGAAGPVRARRMARPAGLRHGRLLQRRPRPRRRGTWPRSGRSATRWSTCSAASPTPRCSPTWTTPSPRATTTTGRPSSWPGWTTGCWPSCGSCSPPARSPRPSSGFLHLGGALNERGRRRRGRRQPRRPLSSWASTACGRPDEPDADRFRRWVRDAWTRLRPFSTGATYVNFQTADEDDDRVRASYGANYDRLVEVKRR